MLIVNPNENGSRYGQGANANLNDARRRQQNVDRRVAYAREAGLLEAKLSASNRSLVNQAAKELANAMQSAGSSITRQQVEEEQRADERRLVGWKAAPPLPGSPHEEEPERIRYRMAVRARALEMIMATELGNLISPTGGYRPDPKPTPRAKPWRPGSSYGAGAAQRGGPISRKR